MDIRINPSFEWLREECADIKSRRFHIFDALTADDFFYDNGPNGSAEISGDFSDFLREFGLASLFTDYRDSPVVSVYPVKSYRRHECEDGRSYVGFGFRAGQSVYFDERCLLEGRPSPVFTVSRKAGKEIAPGFSTWLKEAYEWAKKKYSKSQWERVVAGPPPFSEEELSVVQARSRFEWALTGRFQNGDAIFRITNSAARTIPYLTVGIKDKAGVILTGAAWLDVGHVKPGETAEVAADCYKDRIPPDQLVAFEMPEPIPEKKEMYWEFGRPQ